MQHLLLSESKLNSPDSLTNGKFRYYTFFVYINPIRKNMKKDDLNHTS